MGKYCSNNKPNIVDKRQTTKPPHNAKKFFARQELEGATVVDEFGTVYQCIQTTASTFRWCSLSSGNRWKDSPSAPDEVQFVQVAIHIIENTEESED